MKTCETALGQEPVLANDCLAAMRFDEKFSSIARLKLQADSGPWQEMWRLAAVDQLEAYRMFVP